MGTLANGIKDIFSTSQTTATHLPVCASDGTPQGRISVGDLASVLGGWYESGKISNGDLNDLGAGMYHVRPEDGGAVSNCPSSYNGILYCSRGSDNNTYYKVQIYWEGTGTDKKMYYRTYVSSWGNWQAITPNIPAFYKSYQTLAALATAVGGLQNSTTQSLDCNAITTTGIYNDNNSYTNVPTPSSHYGLLVHFGGTNYSIQLYFGGNSSGGYNLYSRYKAGSEWKGWNKITMTEL